MNVCKLLSKPIETSLSRSLHSRNPVWAPARECIPTRKTSGGIFAPTLAVHRSKSVMNDTSTASPPLRLHWISLLASIAPRSTPSSEPQHRPSRQKSLEARYPIQNSAGGQTCEAGGGVPRLQTGQLPARYV